MLFLVKGSPDMLRRVLLILLVASVDVAMEAGSVVARCLFSSSKWCAAICQGTRTRRRRPNRDQAPPVPSRGEATPVSAGSPECASTCARVGVQTHFGSWCLVSSSGVQTHMTAAPTSSDVQSYVMLDPAEMYVHMDNTVFRAALEKYVEDMRSEQPNPSPLPIAEGGQVCLYSLLRQNCAMLRRHCVGRRFLLWSFHWPSSFLVPQHFQGCKPQRVEGRGEAQDHASEVAGGQSPQRVARADQKS